MSRSNRKFLYSALCAILALAGSFLNASPANAQGPYQLSATDFAVLSTPANYGVVTMPINGRVYTLNYLLYNNKTSKLAGGKTKTYFVLGPVPFGVQVGSSDQCVAFGVAETGAPATGQNGELWKRGPRVMNGNVPPGTLVATFAANGNYYGHTTIFRGYAGNGFLAWSQNAPGGFGAVIAHSFSTTNTGGVEDAGAYYAVLKR